jgi:hypothetical protein
LTECPQAPPSSTAPKLEPISSDPLEAMSVSVRSGFDAGDGEKSPPRNSTDSQREHDNSRHHGGERQPVIAAPVDDREASRPYAPILEADCAVIGRA